MTAAHDSYAALRISNFRFFLIALFTLTLAVQIQGVIVSWQIYEVTHDPLSLGLIGLAEALPFLSIALYAGHVTDRVRRQRLAMISTVVLLLCALALLLLTLFMDVRRGAAVWPFYAVIVASGAARSFLGPARTALAAELVPRPLYPNAATWRSSSWQAASVLGPAAGGLIYGFSNATLAYGVDAALIALSVAALAAVRHTPAPRPPHTASLTESLTVGARFLRGEPVLLGAITLDLFAVLFGGAVALLPIFAASILNVGPQGLGLLRAAPAAGAVTMSVLLAHRPPFEKTGPVLLGAVALFGLCMLGFGVSRNFELSLALLVLSGMADMVSVVIRSTLIQVLTPEHMLGRVSSVEQMFVGSSNEIGAFESGLTAKLIGTTLSVVLGGVGTLVVVGAIAARIPMLRRLGRVV